MSPDFRKIDVSVEKSAPGRRSGGRFPWQPDDVPCSPGSLRAGPLSGPARGRVESQGTVLICLEGGLGVRTVTAFGDACAAAFVCVKRCVCTDVFHPICRQRVLRALRKVEGCVLSYIA